MAAFVPAYLKLLENGELHRRVGQAYRHLRDCDLCARYCHVNRLETRKGAVCRTGELAVVASYGPHHGEEDPLRGRAGSGTIFFAWCNLRCVFCQNWQISHIGMGREVTPQQLAAIMLELQHQGCHNINFVSPSPHFSPPIYCDSPMARATRLSLGRAAQQSVDYACAALGRESRVARAIVRPQ